MKYNQDYKSDLLSSCLIIDSYSSSEIRERNNDLFIVLLKELRCIL